MIAVKNIHVFKFRLLKILWSPLQIREILLLKHKNQIMNLVFKDQSLLEKFLVREIIWLCAFGSFAWGVIVCALYIIKSYKSWI